MRISKPVCFALACCLAIVAPGPAQRPTPTDPAQRPTPTDPAQQSAPTGPAQPLPYSHKIHAGDLNLPCKTCHPNPDPGERMTFPKASTCMQCHTAIKKESPAIQQLAKMAQEGGEIPWVRVYEIPSYVYFSHRAHSKAGAKCMDCHGQVSKREVLFKEADISMGACMDCHIKNKASIDCQYCHEPIEQ